MSFDIDNPYDAAFRGAHEVLLNRIRSAGRGLQITTPERLSAMDHGEATGFVVSALPLVKEKEQLKIFSHYLQVMKFVTDPQRIPADILAPSFGWNPLNLPCDSGKVFVGNPTESRLQSRVFSALESRLREQSSSGTKFEVVSEVSSFAGVFPVDAAIIRNGKILALLEVDGPQHYRPFDGSLRRKDKLKCAMYTKKHPNSIFHRIRWDEENKIGADILVDEIVRDLIEKAGKENWFTSSFGNVRRTFEDLMSWGLRNSKDEFS